MHLVLVILGGLALLWGIWGVWRRVSRQDFAVLPSLRVGLVGAVLLAREPISSKVMELAEAPLDLLRDALSVEAVDSAASVVIIGAIVGVLLPVRHYSSRRRQDDNTDERD